MHERDVASKLGRWATTPCPPLVEILVTVSTAFTTFDPAAVDGELDDLGRRLFGLARADLSTSARELAALLTIDPRFGVDERDPAGLLLASVLERRRGHPLLLAAVLAEAGRRAGLKTGVFSSPAGWCAGVSDRHSLWLVETTGGDEPPPEQVRRHCAHEVAFAVLTGLEQRYLLHGQPRLAERSRALSRELSP